ncbi:hypothetical protein B0J13DRAFT_5842 [Dactylonectria estremocensis]|uniref:Uncharacterized protein n=1 Tax=Dactylonectria estremocensis TaxID=1079267 RepID=A0A9P9JDC6_9HYPO|nr:hypothetical protein B0J13DRAFT_5842 [Dactylonectria estremocensis]
MVICIQALLLRGQGDVIRHAEPKPSPWVLGQTWAFLSLAVCSGLLVGHLTAPPGQTRYASFSERTGASLRGGWCYPTEISQMIAGCALAETFLPHGEQQKQIKSINILPLPYLRHRQTALICWRHPIFRNLCRVQHDFLYTVFRFPIPYFFQSTPHSHRHSVASFEASPSPLPTVPRKETAQPNTDFLHNKAQVQCQVERSRPPCLPT